LYEIGQELEANPDKSEKLKVETGEIVDELFSQVGMTAPNTLVDSMLSMTHAFSEGEFESPEIDQDKEADESAQLPAPSSDTELENAKTTNKT
jgi:hypothetical protein